MRLLEPDVGEVLDRLCILDLKITAGMKKGVSTANWEEEHRQLDAYISKRLQSFQTVATSYSAEAFGRLNAELCQVNMKLWLAEDEIRRQMRSFNETGEGLSVAATAVHIANLNDARAGLVGKINQMFGVQMEAKIYA